MDPNQQPDQTPIPPQQPAQAPPPPPPQQEPRYSTGTSSYDPNYLDSIAAAPPAQKFFSGSFGKIFFVMIGLFVLAVSLIVAFQGGDNTATLQQVAVRLDDMSRTTNTVQKNLTSNNLKEINTKFKVWIDNTERDAEGLLKLGGVKKTDYSKDMIRSEEALMKDLDAKFEDARLSVRLHRVYSTTMTLEIEKLISLFTKLSKNPSSKIQEFATNATKNVEPIKKEFSEYVDDGN